MTSLRKRMSEDIELRGLAPNTRKAYIRAVVDFARFYGKSPEKLGRDEVRSYLLHLVQKKRVARGTYNLSLCAIRFLYRTTLGRDPVVEGIQYPKSEKKLPVVLSLDGRHAATARLRPALGAVQQPFPATANKRHERRRSRPASRRMI